MFNAALLSSLVFFATLVASAPAPASPATLQATTGKPGASSSGGSFAATTVLSAPPEWETVPPANSDPDYPAWSQTETTGTPQAINVAPSASVLAPHNAAASSASTGNSLASSSGAPVPASTSLSAAPEWETVAPASSNPNYPVWAQTDTTGTPQAINGALGASVLGPQNVPIDRQNPDFLAPPTVDSGDVDNFMWPFSLSHNRLQTGGWARQQNTAVMPAASSMASVDMRLEAGAIRELHWHKSAEWGYVMDGSVRISVVNTAGQVYEDIVNTGDIWYFPAGIPHSIQATNDNPQGTEFLLIFDQGDFSEDSTFQLTDWMAHVPMEVLAKNFQVNMSTFDHIPSKELYIFPGAPPAADAANVTSPQGESTLPYTYKLSQVPETNLTGGSIKIVDTRTFPVATTICGAVITVEPGAMRELHWHPTQPEWNFVLYVTFYDQLYGSGTARNTIFASSGNARTFDYQAGDIGYVPPAFGHYIENTGNTTLKFLEIFNSNLVQDISLTQWLALTPPELVQAHLGFDNETIAHLSKTKLIVV